MIIQLPRTFIVKKDEEKDKNKGVNIDFMM